MGALLVSPCRGFLTRCCFGRSFVSLGGVEVDYGGESKMPESCAQVAIPQVLGVSLGRGWRTRRRSQRCGAVAPKLFSRAHVAHELADFGEVFETPAKVGPHTSAPLCVLSSSRAPGRSPEWSPDRSTVASRRWGAARTALDAPLGRRPGPAFGRPLWVSAGAAPGRPRETLLGPGACAAQRLLGPRPARPPH